MRKTFLVVAAVAIAVPLLAAAQAGAAATQKAATPLTVVMHDPGCHWFSLAGKYQRTASVKGPVALLNLDEAALKVVGPGGVKHAAVGKKLVLTRGSYRITMVGQAPDDNTLRLTVA